MMNVFFYFPTILSLINAIFVLIDPISAYLKTWSLQLVVKLLLIS